MSGSSFRRLQRSHVCFKIPADVLKSCGSSRSTVCISSEWKCCLKSILLWVRFILMIFFSGSSYANDLECSCRIITVILKTSCPTFNLIFCLSVFVMLFRNFVGLNWAVTSSDFALFLLGFPATVGKK